jgi:hypothetical protein
MANDERRMVDSLMPRIERGSSVLVLGFGSQGPQRLSDPLAPGGRVLAERGGRVLPSFTEYPIAPVLVHKKMRWDEPVMRVSLSPRDLRPSWDFTRFRYLLARVPDEGLGALVESALEPDARLAGRVGPWRLFESTRALVPIDSPGAALPEPAPPTIQERVNALRAARPVGSGQKP